jgi:hypothetical protein
MKRHDYIKTHAAILKRDCDKRDKLSARYTSGDLTHKATQKLNAELNFLGMNIAQTEERLAFALGLLLPERAREEYRPSPFHTYKGIRQELERTKFDG